MNVKTNGAKAWGLAARPKTLTGAAAPVMIGAAAAFSHTDMDNIKWTPIILAMLFALAMQIDANLINDFYDFKKGADGEGRLGPERACAQGWVTLKAMKWAIAITSMMAVAFGLPLISYGGWEMVAVGAACLIFAWLYTTHLSYWGLGDILVLIFFGLVPVLFTEYLSTGHFFRQSWMLGLAMGLATDCLLIVNNYRDIEQDKLNGKITLIVRIGKKWARHLYLFCGFVAVALVIPQAQLATVALTPYIFLHFKTYKNLATTIGRPLNHTLGLTARNIFIFAILASCALILHKLIQV